MKYCPNHYQKRVGHTLCVTWLGIIPSHVWSDGRRIVNRPPGGWISRYFPGLWTGNVHFCFGGKMKLQSEVRGNEGFSRCYCKPNLTRLSISSAAIWQWTNFSHRWSNVAFETTKSCVPLFVSRADKFEEVNLYDVPSVSFGKSGLSLESACI